MKNIIVKIYERIKYYLFRIYTEIIVKKVLYKNTFAKEVLIFSTPKMVSPEKIRIGKFSRINQNVFLHGDGGITLGENVTLSYGVSIFTTGYSLDNWKINSIQKEHYVKPVVIADNVWIGANATLLPGVFIEEGIVVGSGSVVSANLLEAYCFYAGVPAKKIKKLI